VKISFSNWGSKVSLTNKRDAWCVVSLICILAGSYLVGRYFRLLVVLLVGIGVILVGRAARGFLNRKKAERAQTPLREVKVPQITSRWEYRPREAVRRDAAFQCEGAETAGVVSSSPSTPDENDNVWFDFTNPRADGRGAEGNSTAVG
jgi:hypothetical protein